jgi:hypothetical protein
VSMMSEKRSLEEEIRTFGKDYFDGNDGHVYWIGCRHSGFHNPEGLKKAQLSVGRVDLIEINEASAAVPLVSMKILAKGDSEKMKRPEFLLS